MMVTCSRREEADKLSGSRASYCFDLDVNEEPDEPPPENAYSVDAYGCGMPYDLCVSTTELMVECCPQETGHDSSSRFKGFYSRAFI